MSASDPWSWTVDELVAQLCHSNALFLAAGYASNTPDLQALEGQLRSQGVTGTTFLTVLDRRTLVIENDLEIPRLSQRIALMAVVELLRNRSYAYKQRAATAGVGSLNINKAQPSLSERLNGSSIDDTLDDAGRKRRKVTHISRAPLSTVPRQTIAPIASAAGPSEQALANEDEFSHLLRWQNAADNEELDLAAEEDIDDDEQYIMGDAAEEDPRDVPDEDAGGAPGPPTRTRQNQDQIVDIINERIEFYTNAWAPNKGVVRGDEIEYDPQRMWEEAEAPGERQALVKKYQTDHAYYSLRLDRICEEIVAYAGSNADTIRRQCGNLEVTIESMELADWLLGIYKLEPVEDSEESGSDDGSIPHDGPVTHPNHATHRSRPSTEVIDLGSPSGSCDIEEGNASPFDHPTGSATEMAGDRFDAPVRFSTPDRSSLTVWSRPYNLSKPNLLQTAPYLYARR